MKINLFAKVGTVTLSIGGDPSHGKVPVLTIDIQNPQILYDEGTNKIQVVETE